MQLDQTEVRLLGPLVVRRADGSVVAAGEWRTQKVVELLRLLALTPGEAADAEVLVGELWPEVADDKARASLRTATYHLRRVLGDEHVERRGSGLALVDVWVDAQAYTTKASEADAAHRAHQHAATVSLVREAEALHVDDIDVRDASPRLAEEAARVARLRRTALLQGAEAAATLGWMRDAHELAELAHTLDPRSERAARVLMRALAGIGEVQQSLAVFEHLRHELGRTLGVDPSPQTRALHLQLLTGMGPHQDGGNATPGPVDDLVLVLQDALDAPGGAGVVLVEGEPGSGRSLVAGQACARLGLTLRHVRRESLDASGQAAPLSGRRLHDSLLWLPAVPEMTATNLGWYLRTARQRSAVLVVPVDRLDDEVRAAGWSGGTPVRIVKVARLDRTLLAATAADVLQGPPSDELLDALMEETDGLAGLAIDRLRSMISEGLVVWTPDGLTARRPSPRDRLALAPLLQRLTRSLPPEALDVLTLVGVIDVAVTLEEVERLLARLHARSEVTMSVEQVMDRLVDLGLLEVTPLGYRLRNEDHRDELIGWLRPAATLRLHRAVAEELDITPLDRARHLVAGGRHQAACDLGTVELQRASDRGDLDEARAWVALLDQLPGRMQAGQEGPTLTSRLNGLANRVNRTLAAVVCAAVVCRSWIHGDWELAIIEGLSVAI